MNTLRQPLLRELTAAILVALLLLQSATAVAPGPAWWSTQGVTDPSAVADDFAVANIGQLKHMAAKAAAAMDAELPGGAGAAIHALVDAWGDTLEAASKPGNGLAINQGQLKHVATPFYDRLGLPYPWAGSSALRDDYLLVNLGQLKHVFSFPLKFRTLGQGAVTIPQATLQAALDAWNALPAKPLGSTAGDFDGDGIPNLQEYLMGHALFDPLDIDGDRIADAVEDAHPGILSKLNFADAVWDKEAGGAAAYYDLDWNVSYQGDGVMNYEEVLRLGLDPAATTTSTRTDGLTDAEVLVWTLNAGAPLALNADPLRTFWEGIDAGWMDATANGSYLGWLDTGDANNDGEPDGLAEFRADMLDPWPVWEPWNPSVWTVQAPSPVSFFDPVTLSSVLMDWDEDGMADTDRDDDGLPDLWEYRYEFNLRDGEDRNHDADNDGLTNLEEYQLGTNPRLADTDGDGFDDHSESTGGGDPLVATIVPALSLSLVGSSHPYVFPGQMTPALAVKVTQGDLPVAGVTVVFDLGATAGRLLPAMHLAASPGVQMSVTTGADGVAAVTYAAGSEPGSASITATAPGITGAVEFGVTVVPVPQPFGAGGSGGGGTYGGPATVQPSQPPRSGAATAQETAAATSDGFRIRVKRRDGADDDPVDAKPYSDLVPEYLQPSGLNLAALVGYQISFDVHSWQFHTRLDFEPLPMSGPYRQPVVPGGARRYLVLVYQGTNVEPDWTYPPKHVGVLTFQYTKTGARVITLTENIPFVKREGDERVSFEPPAATKAEERVWIRLTPVELRFIEPKDESWQNEMPESRVVLDDEDMKFRIRLYGLEQTSPTSLENLGLKYLKLNTSATKPALHVQLSTFGPNTTIVTGVGYMEIRLTLNRAHLKAMELLPNANEDGVYEESALDYVGDPSTSNLSDSKAFLFRSGWLNRYRGYAAIEDGRSLISKPPQSMPSKSFLQSAGAECLSVSVLNDAVSGWALVMNQSDTFYFSGHGLTGHPTIGDSFSPCHLEVAKHENGEIETAFPDDLAEYWARDLFCTVIAGCAVLNVNNWVFAPVYQPPIGPVNWPGLQMEDIGPRFLLGYGSRAPLDTQGASPVARLFSERLDAGDDCFDAWRTANGSSKATLNAVAIEKGVRYGYFKRIEVLGYLPLPWWTEVPRSEW